jgi:hypothetical protein
VRSGFRRAHNDLFEPNYSAEFFDYTAGTYDSGDITGQNRESVGTENVEIVPPATDTTIDRQGTDLSFSTSIRFPDTDDVISELTFPGDGVDKPGEVEIQDDVAGEVETYQLHAYSGERGSGMLMVRLEEL